ncbi:MAG: Stk1 family PASTA domain-containing Ser/Thr kinase [Solirubrobacterales bacterium]
MMSEIAENTIVDGRYRIVERVGSGGMADVYLAEDTHLGRRVALKLLHSRFAQDKEFVERFRREASAAAGLQHPNVVGVYDRGEFDGTYYIAMEYCEGETLKSVVDREAPLDAARAIRITKQMLVAARFAHKRGVIHRDLKPQNVVLDSEDNVKVMDFGIARQGTSDITEVGAIMGTAQYLSPEQAQGTEVTAASDLYSIGVVLYEMLTAHAPFEGESAVAVALKHVSEIARPPRDYVPIAPAVEAVVMKSLAKLPADRYGDADSFIRDLDAAAQRLEETVSGDTARFAAVPVPVPIAEAAQAATTLPEPEPVAGDVIDYPPPVEETPEERARRRRRNAAIFAACGGLAVIAVLLLLLLRSPEQRKVPLVIGQTLAAAQQELQSAGFEVDITRRADPRPVNVVADQVPRADTEADKGATVTLIVSNGPGTVKVPDVIGLSESVARDRIKRAGLKPAFRKESSTKVAEGLVIRTDPGADNAIDRDSAVVVFVSSGAKLVSVPDVVGLESGDAKQQLSAAGFNVVVEQKSSNKPDGTVISQSPAGGQEVDERSTVTITVSNGQLVEVPGVVGLSEGDAASQIDEAGFNASVRTKTVTDPDQDGIVLSQSPSSGSQRSKGSTVTLTVGQFEPPGGGGTP